MKKLMIPALAAVMSLSVFAEDAAKPATDASAANDSCKAVVKGDDAMKYDIKEIKINKASCTEFTVEIDHVGKLPAAAMGHNVVITKSADVDTAAKDGIAAGAASNYVKADDPVVIAHTKLVGGGEKDSVTFKTDKLEAGGDYAFFCSFPGHYAVMRGKVIVE